MEIKILKKIVEEKGLKQQSDPKALEALIDKIINDNRDKAVEYKQGKEKLFGFFCWPSYEGIWR